jgi:hypothetical protein
MESAAPVRRTESIPLLTAGKAHGADHADQREDYDQLD